MFIGHHLIALLLDGMQCTKSVRRLKHGSNGKCHQNSEPKVILEHIGHMAANNKDNYQCPNGIREVEVMGKMLGSIDKDKSMKINACTHNHANLVRAKVPAYGLGENSFMLHLVQYLLRMVFILFL